MGSPETMTSTAATETSLHRVAMGVVGFLGLSQGAVPLVARGLFDREQRFALALRLPTPWWWIACIAISGAALALIVVIDNARQQSPVAPTGHPHAAHREHAGSGGYDALSGLVFLVGIYNGVAPFISRLLFDGNLLLAFPLRLPSPWWWITSLAVIVVATALLTVIDNAKKAHVDE